MFETVITVPEMYWLKAWRSCWMSGILIYS